MKKLFCSALVATALLVSSCSKKGDGRGGDKYMMLLTLKTKKNYCLL